MSYITRVYLITGFLGSGKTTFLNRIIDKFPKNRKLTILMNEFGEIGVDGTLVKGEDIDMMEISKGSIFCVCVKTDFIKGLYELSEKVRPDVLLIESTGVANPTDLKRDLELPIFNDRFQFQEQFCLIDAQHFLDAYGAYASVEKQIASSTLFIINKVDLASPERIEESKKLIRELHPDPAFYEAVYADIPFERFFFPEEMMGTEAAVETGKRKDLPPMTDGEMDKFLDDLLDNPDLELTPPDRLVSATYQWSGGELREVAYMAGNLPSSLIRAKGFVEEKGKIYLFSYVMGDWSLVELDMPKERVLHKNVVVFIGSPDTMDDVDRATKGGNWTGMGVFEPLSGAGPKDDKEA
jgi:G3E family GTPase